MLEEYFRPDSSNHWWILKECTAIQSVCTSGPDVSNHHLNIYPVLRLSGTDDFIFVTTFAEKQIQFLSHQLDNARFSS